MSTVEGGRSPSIPYFFLERYARSYVDQWTTFVTAIRAGSPMAVTGADGRALRDLAESLQRAIPVSWPWVSLTRLK